MGHLSDGTLRRLMDEPAGATDADREHIVGCPVCRSELAAAREDATVAAAALDLELTTDVDAGWGRLSRAVAEQRPPRRARIARGRRWRTALRNPVVAGVAAVAILAGAGAAAATGWLQIFRTEQVAPITAPEAELVTLPELSDFGDVEVLQAINTREVADAAAVREATGLDVPAVAELPRGVTGEPRYQVIDRVSALFTFSAQKAAAFSAAKGATLPPPPEGLDGSQFQFVAGPGFAAFWSDGRPVPAMVVARITAPVVYSSGVPFETARQYLLSLPVLPEDVAAQLRNFTGDGTTLPLFTSAEHMATSAADVAGSPATVLASRDGVFAGVVWVDDGVVTGVAGSLSVDEVLAVARGLRWGR